MLDDLKVLECSLRDQLHAHVGRVLPFQVQCIFKDGVLWVLAQHNPEVVIDTQDTFRVLEKTLQAEQPDRQLPVKLYLRKAGDKKPYSTENFTIYPSIRDALPGEAAPTIDNTELTAAEDTSDQITGGNLVPIELERAPKGITINSSEFTDHEGIETAEASLVVEADSSIHTDFIVNQEAAVPPSDQEANRAKEILDRLALGNSVETAPSPDSTFTNSVTTDLTPPDFQSTVSDISGTVDDTSGDSEAIAFAHDIENSFAHTNLDQPKSRRGLWAAGGIGLVALLGAGGYGLSRPCVLGACPQLAQSQTLAEKSLSVLNGEATGKEILAAQNDMHQSITQFKSVPIWSSSHSQAQADLKKYEAQSNMLDITVDGMKKAARASDKTSKQPVSQSTWKESQKLWEGAIADLRKVSADSRAYPLAQQKLTEYQKKLDSVNQNITSEAGADKILSNARVLGVNTTAKQAQVKTLEDWQAVQKDWKTFNAQIAEIPSDVTAYPEAQKLQKDYQQQIAAVNDKLSKEKKHGETYEKAQTTAASAKKSGEAKKLEESLASWNSAIATLQNIPADSIYQPKAEALNLEYTKAMKQTETAVVVEKKSAQASEALKKICDGKPAVCSYKLADNKILVTLLADYAKTVRKTAEDANKVADQNAQTGLIRHINSLGDALESVSNNAQIPLQLYSDSGKLIQTYAPRKS
jgi:hypothetical protein